MYTIFISYKTEDIQYVRDIQSLSKNPNNPIKFIDQSLPEPVTDEFGNIITKPPSHPEASEVRNNIYSRLESSDKLLIIVGKNTHSSQWVEWEIRSFIKINRSNAKILLMRHKENYSSGMPIFIGNFEVHNWDPSYLRKWQES